MKATKLPSGKWRARAYDQKTGRTKSFTADTKKEAERLASAYEFTAARGFTVRDACAKYIENRNKVLSPNTIKDYSTTLRLHTDWIGDFQVEDITSEILQTWINKLSEKLSPKSVKNCYGFILSAVSALRPQDVFKVKLPSKIRPNTSMPSELDIALLMSITKGTDIEVPVKLALFCCMRRGEIAALLRHPECIGKASVTVRYNMIKSGDDWIEKSPKTYSSYRTIPCPPELCEAARTAQQVTPGTITDRWIKLTRKAGFTYRFHDLRHAAASMMLSVMPRVDVEAFGGWSHGSAVLNSVYTYNVAESMSRSAKSWQDKIDRLAK